MAQVTGRITVNASGVGKLDSLPGAKLMVGGIKRDPVAGDHSLGHKESREPATVECEILATAAAPIETLRNLVGATIDFRADNGIGYAVKNAFVSNGHELGIGGEGKIAVKFAGDPAVRN